ncbi:VIT1/CCC1 transporter family protein [uncultured Bosea sp.]|uniref:VIT1/CCC1 transporter family protein n=1 Tax=uncultured Bosea sp. TaxID=211457 RepID=UPI0025CE28DF|nr:VIT1/CCC1 transporter family protein [uncultured Bosea sp.]
MRALHKENHLIERIGWLRAAVLGANDGLISTSSLIVALLAPAGTAARTVSIACLIGLAVLGAVGARAGGASIWKPTLRVVFWGAVAMASTAMIGSLIGRAA